MIREKILKIVAGIATAAAAVFYILFQNKKTQQLKDELEIEKANNEAAKKRQEAYVKGMKKNEELKNKARTGSDTDRDNAAADILQNAASKGRKRNS